MGLLCQAGHVRSPGPKPDRIQVLHLVIVDECCAIFGTQDKNMKKFRYLDCADKRIVGKIEKMWPVLNSKSEMSTNNLLSLEFIMGILAEEKTIKVNWLAFGEDTIAKHRQAYYKKQGELIKLRAELLAQSGQCILMTATRVLGESDSRSNLMGLDVTSNGCGGSRELKMCPDLPSEWMSKLTEEVQELLRLSSLKWYLQRELIKKASAEKMMLSDQTR